MKKRQLIFIAFVVLVVALLTITNLRISFRKSRDAQRIGDINTIANVLAAYQADHEVFPPSEDGKIVACGSALNPKACEWGDPFDERYIKNLPRDPQFAEGKSYRYVTDGARFQLYAALESTTEPEYSLSVFLRSFPCGLAFCNFGKASGSTPLDKTIEEYENEIRQTNDEKKPVRIHPN